MNIYFTAFIALFYLGYNHAQTSLQYVFSNEEIGIRDIAIFENAQIGIGQSNSCGSAYVCGLTDSNQNKWEKNFDFLSYSFFSDILRINDSEFYAVGEEWLADDIQTILSIFVAHMDIYGKLISFDKYNSPQLLANLSMPVNCKLGQLPNKDLVMSVGMNLVYIGSDRKIYQYTEVKNKIVDFISKEANDFYYVSDSTVNHYSQNTSDTMLIHGFNGLKKLQMRPSGLYFSDSDYKLYHSDSDGQDLRLISDSVGALHVYDFEFNKDTLFAIGDDLNGMNQLFIIDEHDLHNNKMISLAGIPAVSLINLDVDESGLLLLGACKYGWPNLCFITMDHNVQLPGLSKDLEISELQQTEYTRKVNTIFGGYFTYDHHFSFSYKITNHGLNSVESFNVYSDDFFAINCYHMYYRQYHIETLQPGNSVYIIGQGDIQNIGLPVVGICLKVSCPDSELDYKPDDNYSCITLVSNDDPQRNDSDLNIYPNPVHDIIMVSGSIPDKYKILNALGNCMYEFTHAGQSKINLQELPAGFYTISNTKPNHKFHPVKFIKI